MASWLPATVKDLLTVNKFVHFPHSTADRPLTIWRFDVDSMAFLVPAMLAESTARPRSADSEGLPADATQGAWAVLTAQSSCLLERRKSGPVQWPDTPAS